MPEGIRDYVGLREYDAAVRDTASKTQSDEKQLFDAVGFLAEHIDGAYDEEELIRLVMHLEGLTDEVKERALIAAGWDKNAIREAMGG